MNNLSEQFEFMKKFSLKLHFSENHNHFKFLLIGVTVILCLVLYFAVIDAKSQQLNKARLELQNAQRSYYFIRDNAKSVAKWMEYKIPTEENIKKVIEKVSKNTGVANIQVRKKNEDEYEILSIEPVKYNNLNYFISLLETHYGITVLKINVNKTGSNLVRINNLTLGRL
jgi:type II secretory pathway component PulM